VECWQASEYLKKDFLNDVLNVATPSEHSSNQTHDSFAVQVKKLSEGFGFPAQESSDEVELILASGLRFLRGTDHAQEPKWHPAPRRLLGRCMITIAGDTTVS